MRSFDRLHPLELAAHTGEVFAEAVAAVTSFEAALIFVTGGVPVLPVLFAGGHKRPAGGAKVWGTTSADKLRAWWDGDDADLFAVAVACGYTTTKRIGLVCLDLDRKHGVDGIAAWDADPIVAAAGYRVREAAGLTYLESTISGGAHLWWVRPAGLHLGNDPELFGPGVDLRVHREYAVVAPSPGYQAAAGGEDAIALVPPWLVGAAHRSNWEARFEPATTFNASDPKRAKAYLAAVVAGEAETIGTTAVGSRGSGRVRSAFSVGRAIAGCHPNADEIDMIETQLVDVAVANAPDEPEVAAEAIRRSLRDGAERGKPKGPTGAVTRKPIDHSAVAVWRSWLDTHPNGTTRRVGVALMDAAEATGTATWPMTGADLAARAGVARKTALKHRDHLVDAGAFVIERDTANLVRYRLGPTDRAVVTHTASQGGVQAGDARARDPHARTKLAQHNQVPIGDVLGGWRHDAWGHHALGPGGARIVAALEAAPDAPRSTRAIARDSGVGYSVAKRVLPILFAAGAADHDGIGWIYLGLTTAMLDAIAARAGTTGRFETRLGRTELHRAERRRAQAHWAQDHDVDITRHLP